MPARVPAEVFSPGEILRTEIEERGWTQADLADILGMSLTGVGEILNGKRGITAETARGLSDALGTSAESWLNLDARYRLHSAHPRPGTKLRSQIYSKVPVREMVRRQWIDGSADPDVLARAVCTFLAIDSLDDEPRPFPHAARKATSYERSSSGQVAWLCRVAQLAPAVPTSGEYNGVGAEVVSSLRALVPEPGDVRHVPGVLADHGIRFLVVEALPGSRIDGVCFWLDSQSPVIALSLRYGKLHNFWHTLLHELWHVKHGDGRMNAVIDTDLGFGEGDLPAVERAANRFAVESLIRASELNRFIEAAGRVYTLNSIQRFAARIGVHPAIVIGHLAHRSEISWARFGTHLPNVRDFVASSALTDGWGRTVKLP
ncbi:MAG: HigA family addiction module antidote protein [Chloroflexi bacterium]|nr:HigA family addiction module antidote protein [Chloroflexota bacterium]